MSSEAPADRPLVRRVGSVLVAMVVAAIVATAAGILIDVLERDTDAGEIVRGIGIFVLLGTPLAALVRVALHGAAHRQWVAVVYPLATLSLVVLGIALAT